MVTISSAPASACGVVGPVGYQTSSQTFTATEVDPIENTCASRPAWK